MMEINEFSFLFCFQCDANMTKLYFFSSCNGTELDKVYQVKYALLFMEL